MANPIEGQNNFSPRQQSDIYNAGLTVHDESKNRWAYAEALLGGKEPSYVPGYMQRELMAFKIPTIGVVEMYINPQNFTINSKKQISEVRTKGGFVMQYWGEMLDEIRLSGTTGSAGIEGINILRDIYRSEQDSFSSVGAALVNKIQGNLNSLLSNIGSSLSFGRDVNKWLNLNATVRPTLASMAASVELMFQGVTYKGYFKSFSVVERAEQPGVFDYDMMFTSFARRGRRANFMPWHRSPTHGPANSDDFSPNYKELEDGESKRVIEQFLSREGTQ